jgi:hypothetical protein
MSRNGDNIMPDVARNRHMEFFLQGRAIMT